MYLSVCEILGLPEFCDIDFVAGHAGVNRTVTGVNIVEVPTVTHWMKGGEILFSSGFAFGGESCDGCRLLRELDSKNVAALVLKPGNYLKTIDSQMIETANELNFPLLSMPEDRPYSHYIDPIFGLLLNQRAKVLEVSQSICNHLFNITVDDSYFSLCEYVSEHLRQPVFISDGKGNILSGNNLSTGEPYKGVFSYIAQIPSNVHGCISDYLCEHEEENLHFAYIPIEVSNDRMFYLIVVETDESDQELNRAVLPFVARIIQIQELHHHSLVQQKHKIAGDLLGDILEKRYEDVNLILQRGKLLNIDLTQNLVIAVIGFDRGCHNEVPSDGHVKKLSEGTIRNIIRERVMLSSPRVLFLDIDHAIVCLIQLANVMTIAELDKTLFANLSISHDNEAYGQLYVGISRQTDNIAGVPRLYEEAMIALKVSKTQVESKTTRRHFDELGLWKLYPDFRKSNELEQLAVDVLKPLIRYDQENGTEFLEVLKAFYRNNGVISQTAKELFIHKNTMIKYVRKIEEIMGCDLRDYRIVAEILLCLMIS